jgi:hypothetical protein
VDPDHLRCVAGRFAGNGRQFLLVERLTTQ